MNCTQNTENNEKNTTEIPTPSYTAKEFGDAMQFAYLTCPVEKREPMIRAIIKIADKYRGAKA